MLPVRSRRAVDGAPSARPRTRQPSRTGSDESRGNWKELEAQTWSASSHMSESMTAWESENDEPIADMMDDIVLALNRIAFSDRSRADRGATLV